MCGIAGFVDLSRETPADRLAATVRRMALSLRHRGPDDEGAWIEAEVGVALGHRRLSILDLSPAGHQPMESKNGRHVLSYNGEVYNFLELRTELEAKGIVFRRPLRYGSHRRSHRDVGNYRHASTPHRNVCFFALGS